MTVRLRVCAITHRGRVRDHNEDAVGAGGWVLRGEEPEPWVAAISPPANVVIADGMGGHRGGSTASSLAVSAFLRLDADPVDAVAAADRAVHDRSEGDPRLAGMGSTIVAVRVDAEGHAHVVSAGDSRAYRLADGYLSPLTRDDRLTIAGTTTLTQVLGGEQRSQIKPHEFHLNLEPGDRLLLCTDGVHDVLDDRVLAGLLANGPVTAIRDAVLNAGAPDNLSYAVLDALPDA